MEEVGDGRSPSIVKQATAYMARAFWKSACSASRRRKHRGVRMAATLDGFRTLIENSSDAIFLVNAKTEIMYANASTAKVLGYQPEELLGRNGLELVHPQDREDSGRVLKEVLAKPESPQQMHARVRRKNGEVVLGGEHRL
jgi:PAS domain S-box-containing protein